MSATKIRDWLFTLPFLLALGLTLVLGDIAQRIARFFGPRPHEWVVAAMQRVLLWDFRICGTRLIVERSPALRPRRGYLIVSNHQSLFDVPIFGGLLLTNFPKYVSKMELARWIPGTSYNLRRGGNALIDRGDRNQALRALKELGERSQTRNVSVVIYPEGSRARDGRLGEFKPAGTVMLMRAAPDLEIVPTTIDGSWKLLRHKLLPVPFGTTVRVRFGDPIPRRPDEDERTLLTEVRSSIEATLEGWRAGEPATP